MNFYKVALLYMLVLLLSAHIEARRKKNKASATAATTAATPRAKTKTKWSTSSELGAQGAQLATEEHGYYVKRTFMPLTNDSSSSAATLRSPPYLGIPIAWFSCAGTPCPQINTGSINGAGNALQEGFLCDDDCSEPFAPICGKTPSELAVFYNKCKLNVAKCRTHGQWLDVTYEECQRTYPDELAHAERKFRASPYFRDNETAVTDELVLLSQPDAAAADTVLELASDALDEIGVQVAAAEAAALGEVATVASSSSGSSGSSTASTPKAELSNETVIHAANGSKTEQKIKTLRSSV